MHGAEEIYAAIKNSIKDVYINARFLLIIDGLDDILNNTEFKAEIITGLIRAVDEINRVFKKTTLSIKVLILIRDDKPRVDTAKCEWLSLILGIRNWRI